jgi:membrane protein YqaA with SNARE-associated domain
MYQTWRARLESLAESPHALWWLFAIACIEASVFPLPPDVLLLTLCLTRPGRSMKFAAVCVAGSATGALLGYGIGYELFGLLGSKLISMGTLADQFALVLTKYQGNAVFAIVLAGFTPIPFAVFSLAAGFSTIALTAFIPAVIVGRSIRFFLVGGILQFLGPRMHSSLAGLLQRLGVILAVLFVLGIFTMNYLF